MSDNLTTFAPPNPLNIAVLFLVFNRLHTTKQVFEAIRHAKPPRLYIAADGARESREGEVEKVQAVREFVMSRIDWECEVKTLFRKQNLGCKDAPSSAISWFFENEEMGIILEDDCLPDQTFFRFCQEMLERYRHDQRISMVSGDNFQFGHRRNSDSYCFSKYCLIWGWATWRDRWVNSYDVTIAKWPRIHDGGWLADMLGNAQEVDYWGEIFESVHTRKFDTAWDYQWFFANMLEGRVSITPSVNLIANIGAGMDATHTKNASSVLNLLSSPMTFPLVHPLGVFKNIQADQITYRVFFRLGLSVRLRKKLGLRKKLVRIRNIVFKIVNNFNKAFNIKTISKIKLAVKAKLRLFTR